MAQKKDNYFQINSIVKLFQMLETLVCREDWDLAGLALETGIPKTTVHRMLLTLKSLGYVDQNQSGKRYYATTKMFEIGSQAIPYINAFKLAPPIMSKLAAECGESVYLSVLSGIEIVIIAMQKSRNFIRTDTHVGDRFLSYLSSAGKALLSAMNAQERAKLFAGHEFELMTLKGISNLQELEKDVKATRKRGFALIDEELALGIRSVGVPIFNHRCEPVAALSAAAPSARVPLESIPEYGERVVLAGRELSLKLGAANC